MAERHALLIGMAALAAILSCADRCCARTALQSALALAAMVVAMTVPLPGIAGAMLVVLLVAAMIRVRRCAPDHMARHRRLSCLAMAVVIGGLIVLNQGMICGDYLFPLVALQDVPRPPLSPVRSALVHLAVAALLGYGAYSLLVIVRSHSARARAETLLMAAATIGMAA